MTPDKRKEVQANFLVHDKSYTPLCLRHIYEDCYIPYRNLRIVCVCLFIAKEHLQMLDWKLPEKKKFPTASIANFEDDRKYVICTKVSILTPSQESASMFGANIT